jgi:hypothetical protein
LVVSNSELALDSIQTRIIIQMPQAAPPYAGPAAAAQAAFDAGGYGDEIRSRVDQGGGHAEAIRYGEQDFMPP